MSGRDKNEPIFELNKRVARVLRVGAVTSTVLIVVGLAMLLVNHSEDVGAALSLTKLLSSIAGVQPAAFLTMGILAMIITPIARVFVLVAGFHSHKDTAFVIIGSVVLGILLLSIILGLR